MMPKVMTPEEKHLQMTTASIPKLLVSLSIPTTISMLVTSLYNMADTYFVGLLGSASATGAVGVIFPLMAILQAVGFMFGHGSGNHMARSLGAQDTKQAEQMAATGFFSSLIVGFLITAIGLIFLTPMVQVLGATPTIAPYAKDYAFYILLGAPWMVSSLVLNNQLRFQGSAFYGMIGITSGAVLNVILDPIFIFTFRMGVKGAALATMLSQFVGFLVLFAGTNRGSNIRIRFKNFSPNGRMYREIFKGGVPSLFRQGLGSVSIVCLNTAAAVYGDAAVAAMGIVNRLMQFGGSTIIGFGQGFQPICGFNYGAKRYDRVREAFWLCIKVAVAMLVVVGLCGFFFAPQIIHVFLKDDPLVTQIGARALRYQCCFIPMFSFIIMGNMMLQTMGLAAKASVLAAARQGLFLIPCVLILPSIFGLTGVLISQPVSDVCSFLLTVPLTLGVLKELKAKELAGGEEKT